MTVHFPAKEELLLDAEPFTLDSLSERLSTRRPHESALEALRDWMATTMTDAETNGSEMEVRFWSDAPCERTSSTTNPSFEVALSRAISLRPRHRRCHRA